MHGYTKFNISHPYKRSNQQNNFSEKKNHGKVINFDILFNLIYQLPKYNRDIIIDNHYDY